jgi:hypothetical protein
VAVVATDCVVEGSIWNNAGCVQAAAAGIARCHPPGRAPVLPRTVSALLCHVIGRIRPAIMASGRPQVRPM